STPEKPMTLSVPLSSASDEKSMSAVSDWPVPTAHPVTTIAAALTRISPPNAFEFPLLTFHLRPPVAVSGAANVRIVWVSTKGLDRVASMCLGPAITQGGCCCPPAGSGRARGHAGAGLRRGSRGLTQCGATATVVARTGGGRLMTPRDAGLRPGDVRVGTSGWSYNHWKDVL